VAPGQGTAGRGRRLGREQGQPPKGPVTRQVASAMVRAVASSACRTAGRSSIGWAGQVQLPGAAGRHARPRHAGTRRACLVVPGQPQPPAINGQHGRFAARGEPLGPQPRPTTSCGRPRWPRLPRWPASRCALGLSRLGRGADRGQRARLGAGLDDGQQPRILCSDRRGVQLVSGRGEFRKTTTRASAERIVAAWVAAFTARS
jgi:hypothetical protein